jgi:E3 Ubiquitin ligase
VLVASNMPPYPVIALAAALLALFGLYRLLVRLHRERLVADTPVMRIRSAAQGYVKVIGKALPEGPVATTAPLTGRPCVWWSYEIAQREQDARGTTRWSTTDRETSVELFVLSDGDAQCLVGPVKAEVIPTMHNVWYGSEEWPTGPCSAAVNPLLPSGRWRYTERLLGVGAQLCVMGELRSQSETGDINSAAAAKLHEWKQDQKTLLARFDADHDGKLDAVEWEAARDAAIAELQTQQLHSPIARVSVISQPLNGEPFLIAPLSDAQLVTRERRFAVLDFALGLLGVVVCAWALRHLG